MPATKKVYVIGVDYGTDSVRSVVVDAMNGKEMSSAVHPYSRWKSGLYCDPAQNRFRQHPLDYIEGLEKSIRHALAKLPPKAAGLVRGLSVDTTGSTPCAVDERGIPLAMTRGFEKNPNAMFVLWKDHTAVREAEEINTAARTWSVDYTQYVGGVYSSEWFWAKILRVLREDRAVRSKAFSWVEHCDWIPALLTGITNPLVVKRSRCAAGHKAMWHETYEGLPEEAFFNAIDPLFLGIRARLFHATETSDKAVGRLTPEWAKRLGLPPDTVVGVGAFDAHMGAVGAEIEPYVLSKVMGTSTCDMLVAPLDEIGGKLIGGICGQVDGSIIPGMLGMEAGQSAFGDVYAWFSRILAGSAEDLVGRSRLLDAKTKKALAKELSEKMVPALSKQAARLPIDENGVLALDWMNGRRTPYANQALKGAVTGLNLGSDAPKIFRALVEATAFGAKKITDRFIEEGVPIRGVIALGGIPKKSPFVMQVTADVLDTTIRVARSEQACALGAAMFAAVASGLYRTVEQAQKAMGNGFEKEYRPDPGHARQYKAIYEKYSKLAGFVEKEMI
jgi:L-ribulokinase